MSRHLAILGLAILAGGFPSAHSTGTPDVLIVIANDLGWGDLGANGNREVRTPHLDDLSESGIRFEKFYVCPDGPATLASLLTGRYHYRTGVAGPGPNESRMHSSEITLGELFRDNGYTTAWFGPWGHGENWPHTAEAQGFSRQVNSHDAASLTDAALAFMTAPREGPFLAVIYFPALLSPAEGERPAAEQHAATLESIGELDVQAGKLREWIDRQNATPAPLLLFLSDNGPDHFGAREGRYNGHFYGGRGSVHEGGIRVPCFLYRPGIVPPGRRFDRITAHIDWFPTFRDWFGLRTGERQLSLDGMSLAPILHSADPPEHWPNRILFTSWTPPGFDLKNASVSVRTDRWVALRDPRWRRDESVLEERNGWELYDLMTDPFQTREMGDEFPFLLSELRADFAYWMDDTTDEGVAPVAIEIGHDESPRVVLPLDSVNPTGLTWPLRLIREGSYRLEITHTSPSPSSITVLAGDEPLPLALPAAGEEAVILTAPLPLQESIEELRITWPEKNPPLLKRVVVVRP